MNANSVRLVFSSLVAPLLACASMQAAAGPISGVTVSTTFPSPGDSSSLIASIVNGSGLSSYTTGATHAISSPSNSWGFTGPTTGTITFDLGSVFDLDGMAVWNFNAATIGGMQALTIDGSLDGSTYAPIAGAPTVFSSRSPSAAELAELFSFSASVQYVRFNVTSSWGFEGLGLNEVMFTGTSPSVSVPEPASLALAGLALGLAAAATARRRVH